MTFLSLEELSMWGAASDGSLFVYNIFRGIYGSLLIAEESFDLMRFF